MSKIVVALGGNALGDNPEIQMDNLEKASKIIVKLIKEGHDIVITHGNGPQVGQIALAMEYASAKKKTPHMPFAECGSMSQGYIGYQMQQALQDEMERQKVKKDCITVITQVLVDSSDPAFQNPTKPIGAYYKEEEMQKLKKEEGYEFTFTPDAGYRRIVPSPIPKDIIEKRAIATLLKENVLVIACGGGGIPVIKKDKKELLEGIDAVIDKDLSSALLAKLIDADILLILTSVDKVYLNYLSKDKIGLDTIKKSEALKYIEKGEFAKGSMLPKIEACLNFVDKDKYAIITSLDKANEALENNNGTRIIGG